MRYFHLLRVRPRAGRPIAGFVLVVVAMVSLSVVAVGCRTVGPPPARSESAIAAFLERFEDAEAGELAARSQRPFVLDREILRLTPDLELLWHGLAEADLGFAGARIRSIQPVYEDSYRDFADTRAMRRHFERELDDGTASIVEIETTTRERYALLLAGSGAEPVLYGMRGPLAVLSSMRSGRVDPASSTEQTVPESDDDGPANRVIASGADELREFAFPGGRLRFGAYSVAAVSEQQSNDRRILKVTPSLGEFRLEIDAEGIAAGDGEPAITAVELERFGSTVTVVVDARERLPGTLGPGGELVVLAASDGATIFASVAGEFAVQTGGRRTRIGPREALEVLPGGRPGDRLRWIGETIGYRAYEHDRRERFLANPVVGLLQLQRVMARYRSDVSSGGRQAPAAGLAAKAMRTYMLPRLYVAMKVEYFGAFEEPEYLSFGELYRAVTDEYELGIEPRL